MNRDAADVATPAGDAAARPEHLPSVDRVLRLPAVAALIERHGRSLVTTQTREQLEQWRGELRSGSLDRAALADPTIGACIEARVAKRLAPRMKPLINLTGTVIHTNLGRSVLASEALGHLLTTMAAPNNLEYDLADGGRGDRDSLVEELLCTLTGAEAATVVNNNAAAVLLTIAALARDREVIVSRGELVEIGGAFRMPDVMASAGATLREVGTTNRTHPHDYERAIGAQTALLMKVHTSNYSVQGFTATVDEATLAALAHRHGLPLASDLGSGALVDLAAYGLPHEPMPQEMLRAGCDVVSFSGDKLLGGPQAGLIVGRREFIGRIRKTPLKRALRVSKLPLAALEATLRLYLEPEQLGHALPTLRHLTRPTAAIEAQAKALMPRVSAALAPRFRVTTEATLSQIGSGSLPVDRLPSFALRISPTVTSRKGVGSALDHLHAALRALPRPVIGRIGDDALWLDLRCLEAEDEQAMIAQLPLLQQALAN
ncbi:MAG: L-seryl-tRNA(Sec) selenium transferase [Proteobacteria bacterium]|nr:L-seryl-tRNA(Sec) selenium transferase [Pseudomonadota bacterium]